VTDLQRPHTGPAQSATGRDPVASTAGLSVMYGRAIRALRDVTLEVAPGQVVALLGANGAGKTTLLRALSGLLPQHGGSVTAGSISLAGAEMNGRDPVRVAASGVRLVMEGRRLFGNMSVHDNLLSGATRLRGRAARSAAVDAVMDRFPMLRQKAQEPAALLSGGQQQVVAIARALVSGPKLLMLDEPSLGLSPQASEEVAALLGSLHGEGMSILLVEQNVTMALRLADVAYVLNRGAVVRQGDADDLRADPSLSDLYLGASYDGTVRASRLAAEKDKELPWYR
jgi:branched-chain amino acid transport system ATP-binding protein